MINVVSFSGGRTSAYLVWMMEKKRLAGEEVHYLFMDTGAEHPNTYQFIRDVVNNWGIDLTCLRVQVNCENCEVDYRYEDHERDQPIKSAYWRWRAICFCVRWLWFSIAGYRSLRLWLMPRPVAATRSELRHDRRK